MPPSTFDARNPQSIVNIIQIRKNDITISRVAEEQKKNRFCKEVVKFFAESKCPNTEQERKKFLEKIQGFTVRNSMVFKVPDQRDCHPPLPYICDINTRKLILKSFHDKLDAAHSGELRMRLRILKNFWWPTLVNDMRSYTNNCQSCHRAKLARTVKPAMMPIKHEIIWAFVSMDHVGPFPKIA
jgi:hypothetical protein